MKEIITDHSSYDLRYTRILDKGSLIRWISHPEVVRWFPIEGEKEKELFLRNWIGFSRFRSSLTAIYDHKPIGMATLYLMPYKKVAHLSMFNMVVDPAFQRKGVGRSLVRNLIHLAKTEFKLLSIHAEIIEGCPLIGLLDSLGFTEVFHQDDFFKIGEEYLPRKVMEIELT